MGSPSTFAATTPANTAGSNSATAARPFIHRIWPSAMIAIGLGLSAIWACLLGFELVRLIAFAI
jgi:hypothetical protein